MILLGDANWWALKWLRGNNAKHAATPTTAPEEERELAPVG
jgi:RND superfamily putative drug exporter